jgi:hypothetical protein
MRLLAEGFQITTVARQLGIKRITVRDWRDSPEGQSQLADARRARAAAFEGAVEDARQILREAAVKAAQVLADKLDAPTSFAALRAAREILNRVGLPSVSKVETTTPPSTLDLSRLSDVELVQLEQLHAKAGGGK